MTRITLALLAACLLVGPSTAQAATNFGSRLSNDPANSGECQDLATPCTLVSYIHPAPGTGDPYSGGAPTDGVITKFRIRAYGKDAAGPASVTFLVARLSNFSSGPGDDSALATVAARGPTVQITGTPNAENEARIEQFNARVRVKKGEHLGIDTKDAQATYNNSGNEFTFLYAPPLVQGQGPRASNSSTGELLVAATIEPDADKDGFGDESQDRCPGQTGTDGGCARGGSPGAGTVKVKLKGRTLTVTLSKAGKIKAVLQRARKGRRVRGKCRRRTRRNAARRKCTRYAKVRTLTKQGKAGKNSVKLPKKLKAGRYRVIVKVAGVSGKKTIKFKVKKKKRRRR